MLFRGDAAFAKPELYEYLEQGKIGYAIRLPANQVIQVRITLKGGIGAFASSIIAVN